MEEDLYLKARRAYVEELLLERLPAEGLRPALLSDAIRYSILTGGKRVRPTLLLLAFEVAGRGDVELAKNAAAAVEFLHTYTLIHDDLPSMDNDLLRRGQPTVHAKFGEANAILAGDALQAFAFGTLVRKIDDGGRVALLVSELSGVGYGVVAGQIEDIPGSRGLTEDRLRFVQLHKTADIFRVALRMGGIAGGGTLKEVDALGVFGENLGVAFQIIDDILDAPEGRLEETSCLSLMSMDEARLEAKRITEEAILALSIFEDSLAKRTLIFMARSMLERIV